MWSNVKSVSSLRRSAHPRRVARIARSLFLFSVFLLGSCHSERASSQIAFGFAIYLLSASPDSPAQISSVHREHRGNCQRSGCLRSPGRCSHIHVVATAPTMRVGVDGNWVGANEGKSNSQTFFGRPSSSQVSPKNSRSRSPRRSKYFNLIHRVGLFGCLRRAHCDRLEKMV
jgi:hypothetical protein